MNDPTPQRQRRKEARPREILDAALCLFQSKGFAATRMEEVAQAAGVTKGTVYLYYPSKEDLFKAVIRDIVLPNMDKTEELIQGHTTAYAQIEAIMLHWGQGFVSSRGSLTKLIISEAGNFPELALFYQESVIKRAFELITRLIEQGIANGEFRPVNASLLARVLFSPMILSSLWHHSIPGLNQNCPDMQKLVHFHLDIVMHGITSANE